MPIHFAIDRSNRLEGTMRERLLELLRDAEGDDDVRCVVITGAGNAFSAESVTDAAGNAIVGGLEAGDYTVDLGIPGDFADFLRKVGGGGGSRTRVRKYGVEGLYMRVRFVIFMPGVWKRLSTARP